MSGAKGGWIGRGLLVILALSALFRVGYLWQYHAESTFYQDLILDAHLYDEWAGRIAGGEIVPAEPFYFAPGYPYALALVYRLVSSARIAVYVIQALLGLGCIILVHRIAYLAYGARAALFAAGLTALYGSFPFLESKIMSAILALATLLAAMAALASAALRSRPWLWALGGLLLGATSLIRPETLLAGPFLLVWLFLASARGGDEESGSGPLWRRRLPAAALLAGGWALAIAPAAAHNILAGGGMTLISSQGGITFYQSNNPRARGLYTSLSGEGFSGSPAAQASEEKQIAEAAVGHPLDRSEVSSYWFRRGLSFITGHPARFLWLEGMKLLRYAGSYEYSGEYIIYVERESVWLLWLTFVPFALILALAVPSLWTLVRRPRRRHPKSKRKESGPGPVVWLVATLLAANLAACLIFFVSSRYRLPSVPCLIIFAGATLASWTEALRKGRRSDVVAAAVVVALIFGAAHFQKDDSAEYQEANVHFNTGNAWYDRKDFERAAREYERAVQMDDSRYNYLFNLGNAYRAMKRWPDAAEAYTRAEKRRSRYFGAPSRLGEVYFRMKDWDRARKAYLRAEAIRPKSYGVQMSLGRIALETGDRQEAERRFARALEIRPGDTAALRDLAKARHGS